MNISTIISKSHKHNVFFNQTLEMLKKANTPIAFPMAYQVLFDFSKKTEYIFNSILLSSEKDNLYSCFILYRSLLEHFYKSYYIFEKTVIEKSDDTAKKFETFYFVSECLAERAGMLERDDLINNATSKTEFIEYLVRTMPEFQGFDKGNQKEISAAIKQFNLKEILKYLHEKHTIQNNSGMSMILAETIPEYSRISTFIHGGEYATKLMNKFERQNLIQKELKRIVSISLTISGIVKENIFVAFKLEEDFIEIIHELHELRK